MNTFRWGEAQYLNECLEYSFGKNQAFDLSGAFEITDEAKIRLTVPRSLGVTSITLMIKDEAFIETPLCVLLKWTDTSKNKDIYEQIIPIKNMGVGIFFAYVELDGIFGRVFAYKRNSHLFISKELPLVEKCLQISISDFSKCERQSVYGGVIYHIFVDRFRRSDRLKSKDELVDWNCDIPELPEYPGAFLRNDYFYGGDLYGIEEKLDYIKSLGVNIIYLSPIFESPSNHKYDTANYMSIDSAFGGEEALISLIDSAKKKGIDIILDGVFNHTGADSIYFNKHGRYDSVGAYQSKDSKYYSWYEFQDHPFKYTSWWGIDILPRINTQIKECSDFFVGDSGVIDKYSRLGIKGFRLDVVDELSDEFVEKIKARLLKTNPQSLLYGEVWEDASNKIAYGVRKRYFLGYELDGVMNYPIRRGIISYIRYGKTDELRYALCDVINNAPERIRHLSMNLLGSHDTIRIITALAGEKDEGLTVKELQRIKISKSDYQSATKKVCIAYTILASIPGIPSIYYGDEVGLEGYSDPLNRRTFPWGKENNTILNHYRALGKIRREHKVYAYGALELIHLTRDLLIFSRNLKNKKYLTVINNSNKEISIAFSNKVISLLTYNESKSCLLQSYTSEILILDKGTTIFFNTYS